MSGRELNAKNVKAKVGYIAKNEPKVCLSEWEVSDQQVLNS